jgi:cobalt-zinc-cadmium efflux system protein
MNPEPIFAPLMLGVALVGLTGNFASILLLHRFRRRSLNLRAVFLHLLLDTLSSVSVVAAGVLLLFYNLWWLDPIVSLFIVGLVGVSSIGVLIECMRIILQAAPSNIHPHQVAQALEKLDGVESLHGLHIWAVNSTEIFLSCHICARPEIEPDRLIQNINRMLSERFGIEHSAVQIETSDFCNRQEEKCCR